MKKCTYRKEGDLPEATEQDKGRVRWFREVGIRRWLHAGGSNMGIIFIILPSSSTCRNVTSVFFQQDQSADCEVRVCVRAHTHVHEHMGKTTIGQPSSMKASLAALPTGIALYRAFSFSFFRSLQQYFGANVLTLL